MRRKNYDLAIIGGGPAGLYALFWARYLGLETVIFEANSRLGGQIRILYPNVLLRQIPGYRAIRGNDFVQNLLSQLAQFRFGRYTSTRVERVVKMEEGFQLQAGGRMFQARSVLYAIGKGAFLHRRENSIATLEASPTIHLKPPPLEVIAGREILVYGPAASSLHWARRAEKRAARVIYVNRLHSFAERLQKGKLQPRGLEMVHSHDLTAIEETVDGRQRVTLTAVDPPFATFHREVDRLVLLGGRPENLRELTSHGLESFAGGIRVEPATMETSLRDCFAAGDAVFYPGKRFNMRSTFDEALRAVEEIARRRKSDRLPGTSIRSV